MTLTLIDRIEALSTAGTNITITMTPETARAMVRLCRSAEAAVQARDALVQVARDAHHSEVRMHRSYRILLAFVFVMSVLNVAYFALVSP